MTALTLILIVPVALSAIYWIVAGTRARTIRRTQPSVRDGLEHAANRSDWPRLSVIVPAHNEQRVIDACAVSLRAQTYPDLEIIFVLDRCTDDTADILRRHAAEDDRIVLIENNDCPSDWAGKCNAARIGVERATGEWLLFTDADTDFDPELCRASVALAMQRELGLLSLLSTLTSEHRHEHIVQPVAAMALLKIYPMEKINRTQNPRAFANGQFLLFDREWYERIGGHAAVRDDLLEDIAFARLLQKHDGRGGVAFADGMLRCSMYDSHEALVRGWKRIFLEACKRKTDRLRRYGWRQFMIGVLAPAAQLAAIVAATFILSRESDAASTAIAVVAAAIVVIGLIAQFAALRRIYAMIGAPTSAVLFYPLGAAHVARIMFSAACDLRKQRPVKWGGREYVLKPR